MNGEAHMNLKVTSGLLFTLAFAGLLNAQEPESDNKTYMKAIMTRASLSQCLLVGKAEGKSARKAYADWLALRKEAVARIAAQGCGQMCQMMGDPLQPLQKPVQVNMSGPLGSLNMTAEDSKHLCNEGMKAVAEPTKEPTSNK